MLFLFSCTTKKDGFAYRVFHNTTARYNGYFYAEEAMKEGRLKIIDSYTEDYDSILPVFIYGDEASAQAAYPQMERTIEKSSLVIERHYMKPTKNGTKKMKRPEMNKWIDDNYMLIGQSYFIKQNYFKAEELFLFVSRKFKDKNMQAKANTWLARTYMQQGQWTKAKNALLKAEQLRELEDEQRADVHMVFADYWIQEGDYKKAIEQLEFALPYIKKKKDRARPTFILAQLNQKINQSQESINLYRTVLTLRPEYEMEFYARINQAMAYNRKGGNSQQIKDELFKMLKDEKNLEYRDQIYYALAEIELEERNRDIGVGYLQASLNEETGNVKQRTKSFLRLADIFLDEREYQSAQAYYDSTYSNIPETHPRYLDVKNKAQSLTDLVENLLVIEHEDSIRAICDLSDEDRITKLKKVVRQMQEEEDKRRAEEAQRLAEMAASGGGATGDFWAYNDQLRAIGKQNFDEYWGDRPLEDNWRRKNKISELFEGGDEEEVIEVVESAEQESSVPTVEALLAELPCSEAQIADSDIRIANAFYDAGVVYKEKLDDVENAIERWEVLVNRYDDSEVHPTAFYQLYRTYLYREQEEGYQNPFCSTCNSVYWANIVLEKYPGSEWATLVENPDFEDFVEIQRAEEREAYEATYSKYGYRAYQEVILESAEVINTQPNNHLLCKYRLLKAFATGNMEAMVGGSASYVADLEAILETCPDTEEAATATEILNSINGEVKEVVEELPPVETVNTSMYEVNNNERHYFAIIFNTDEGEVNKIKASASDFNTKFFKSSSLRVSSNLLDRQNQIVLVKTFTKVDNAMDYYSTFIGNSEELKEINEAGYTIVLVSKTNYVTLFKTKEVEAYKAFFEENYK
ncbi:MAG: tetratricopeptide repeat protein [Flavobacteriales bacterium]